MEKIYKPLLQESSVNVYYDMVNDWFYLSWFGDQKLKSRMQAFDQVLAYFKVSHCTKILNDNSDNTSSWNDCALWLTTDWLPRAEQYGLTTMAWVYATDPLVRQTAEEMLTRLNSNVTIIGFNHLEDAEAWLHSV